MADVVFNHATVRERADMLEFLELCAQRDLSAVSIWGNEIEKVGEARALEALSAHGLRVSGYNRIGPFTPEGLGRARAELERAARFGADHVFLFTGGLASGEYDLPVARNRAETVIADLLPVVLDLGLKLAIEPLHPMLVGDRTVIASLNHANDICDRLGEGVGVVIDAHHLWWDEQLEAEIARAGRAGRILGFHVNDWLIPTRHLLTDRGMMGDGIIDLAGIEAMVRRAGFAGPVEVEIFSQDWWRRDPAEVMDIALERCAAIFGKDRAA
ncbi:sugar phosphate isomerase/epimerase family protein [Pseudooceanicola sp.]|uniref:sugar phosphate isomerase/epimerase family protein n=1 Tax=Pseudooceanicola sp. TaxID=1914328 RepID=UPI00351234F1